jgi:predicted metalloprotease with PDZ domain
VLAVRSGLWTEHYYDERLAYIAAYLDHEPGRDWRPLVDTTVAAQLLYSAPPQWASRRRSTDFYDEGWLIWLDVDTQIRRLTNGRKSLDDFCHLFHGGDSTGPLLRPYTFDDVVAALNEVAPYDWHTFLSSRVNAITPRAPIDGITKAGWRLTYTDAKNDFSQEAYGPDPMFSLGLRAGSDGVVSDVVVGSPADKAGIGAGMQVLAVNGVRWSPERLRDALTQSRTSGHVTLNVQNDDVVKDLALEYRDGVREPHLERVTGTPDVLAQIIAPHAR